MRILSLLDSGAQVMAPDARDYYVGTSRFAIPASDVLFTNVSRPGKIPNAGDIIALRDIVTNRRIVLARQSVTTSGSPLRFWRSPLLTDYNSDRYNALIRILAVIPREDGMCKWTLAPKSSLPEERLDVVVWDRSVVAQMFTAAGAPVVLEGTGLQTGDGPAAAPIGFHSLSFNDVLDLHWDERVWLSVGGRPVELDARNNLTTGTLPAPESGRWNGRPFLIEMVDRRGFLTHDSRFRLRSLESTPFPGASNRRVVVRGGQLRLEPDVRDDDAAAFFRYSELVNLDLYWNPTTQDNAIVTGPAPTGYTRVRTEGRAFMGAKNGTVPIKRFFSASRGDTMTTATVAGEEAALTSSAGMSIKASSVGHTRRRARVPASHVSTGTAAAATTCSRRRRLERAPPPPMSSSMTIAMSSPVLWSQ